MWLTNLLPRLQLFHTWELNPGKEEPHEQHSNSLLFSFFFKQRLLLAALHYNHNSCKHQAKTKKGEDQYSISFPKYKKGGFIVREVMEKSNYV